MKYIKFIIITLFFPAAIFSQPANSPYPVIFVHGLNSDDQTWNTTISQLSSSWILGSNSNFSAVLNARGGDTTNYISDVIITDKNINGNIINNLDPSSIYTANFGNFWNRNSSDPRLILYSNTLPGTNQSPSNQSAIYKQGYALKILIDSVLKVTGASKVILAGHSMGGLAIREYLQRRENGIHKWWVNPEDTINGHRVAKVVTIGTPHLGTNVTSIPFTTIDFNSEAIRDMRYTYSSGAAAVYLFTNSEQVVSSSYYNADINCNGLNTDSVTGLCTDTKDNSKMPLPLNISYTWIVSNYLSLGTDLAVPVNRQYLYITGGFAPAGISDTILTNKNHIQETSDARSLIRGLDEPDIKSSAYEIEAGKKYAGFITLQPKGITSDTDFYKVTFQSGGKVTVNLNSLNAGVSTIALLSEDNSVLISKSVSSPADSITFTVNSSEYYLRITGNSNQNLNFNSYNFTVNFIPALKLNLKIALEGFWNGLMMIPDTLKLYLRNNNSPFGLIDSAVAYADNSGNVSAEFIHASGGNYFLQIVHRNSIETWSSTPLNFISGILTDIDFTDLQTKAFGDNLVLKSGRWCIYGGDVNQDGAVDASDMSETENDASNSVSGYVKTDVTGDDFVDADDMSLVENNAANSVEVIKP